MKTTKVHVETHPCEIASWYYTMSPKMCFSIITLTKIIIL